MNLHGLPVPVGFTHLHNDASTLYIAIVLRILPKTLTLLV